MFVFCTSGLPYYTVYMCWFVTVFSLSIRAASLATLFKLCRSLNWVHWLQAKSRADDIRLFLIHTERKIVSAKVRLGFILNQNLVRPAYRLTSVQAVSCFKQTNDTPVHLRFYAQCRPDLKILSGSIKFRFRACCINTSTVLCYANAAFRFALVDWDN